MLEALQVVFPPNRYGIRPAAYFSELPDDRGITIGDLEVQHLTDIPRLREHDEDIAVALVACSPGWVQISVDLLAEAGISGILLLTPSVTLEIPKGVELTHVRMPCDIKSLACRCSAPVHR
jgi:NADH/NAD ratio-sensing transcriptional regulator Rex